jgi:hypothetical protein
MDSTEISSAQWLTIASEAFTQTDGSAKAVAESISARLGVDPLGAAFALGVSELARYAATCWDEGDSAVEAEEAALAISRRVVRPLLEAKLQSRINALDAAQRGACACASCGGPALSQGRRPRRWASTLGVLALRRRYSHCEKCDEGVVPAQKAVGLTDSDFTPRLEEVCTLMATTVPFGMATSLVGKLCGVEVSVKAVQDMTERRGEEVLALEAERAKEYAPFDEKGLPVPTQQRPPDAVPETAIPEVAYLEVDGVIPITREELTGDELTDIERQNQARAKAEKVRGGKGKRFRIVGREVKNAVLYDGKDCAKESVGRGCILAKSYVSFLGEWAPFAARLWVAMLRLRFDQAKLLVVLSDGAEWIRSLVEWLPVPTLLILDLFHVKHRVWEVANSLYGKHSSQATRWANSQCERIEAGEAKTVIASLHQLEPSRADTCELVRRLINYLENNLDRMDYPSYRARGLRIGSGAVESANFHVTGTRLKLQGMRWSAQGAGEMATLRADLFNGSHETRTRELLAAA